MAEELAREVSFEVERKPFLLRPERPPEGEPRRMFDGETETEVSPAMKERADGVGLEIRRPQWSPNTIRAHEVTLYAKERGMDDRFHHVTTRAYWTEGADFNDLAVLQGLAEEAGLDWSDLGPRIEADEYRDAVMREYEAAKEQGVGGTPAYLIDGELHAGDVGIDELREAIKSASQ
ncbi:MAG: hypothetical protein CL759_07955 [Chloroflexi bacterium]|nr:hypothetical protein [Chloroflexota bacterium]